MSGPGELAQGKGWALGWTGAARGCKILARHSVGHTLILNTLARRVAGVAMPLRDTGEWGLHFGAHP